MGLHVAQYRRCHLASVKALMQCEWAIKIKIVSCLYLLRGVSLWFVKPTPCYLAPSTYTSLLRGQDRLLYAREQNGCP